MTGGMTNGITQAMNVAKVTISVDGALLKRIDSMVEKGLFASRSQAVQAAIRESLSKLDKSRLARESAKLDRKIERAMADEGLSSEASEWPAY